MTLEEYIISRGLKKSFISKVLGVSQSYLSNICNGRIEPSLEIKMRIIVFTQGLVSYNELGKKTVKKSKRSKKE